MTIKIAIDEIKLLFESLIKRLEQDKIGTLEVEFDYYWIVPTDEWDDFNSTSPSTVVGSLVDDWNSLLAALKNDQITYLDLERFASILRALSETIAPSQKQSIEDINS